MTDDRFRTDDTDTHPSDTGQAGEPPPAPPTWQPPHWQAPPGQPPQGQQGWQPPQGHAGWQAQQGPQGWQAQQGPQGWQAQQAWQAQQPRHGSSAWAVAGAIALIILGVLLAIIFGLTLLVFDEALALEPNFEFDPEMLGALRVVLAGVTVVAVLQIIGGAGSLARWQWARVMGILTGILGLMVGLLVLLGVMTAPDPIAMAIAVVLVSGYALAVIGLIIGGAHFRRSY